jgi:H2-forming N5,N10-methylenetetrahydromethanopterin dehydrogenase-like enzyme
MDSKISQSTIRVQKNQDLTKENETLAVFVTSLTTLLDALEGINVLLLKHKEVIDSQILEFKTTMAELVQKNGSSSMSLLFKFSCFR